MCFRTIHYTFEKLQLQCLGRVLPNRKRAESYRLFESIAFFCYVSKEIA